jgi:hypothetical protein
MTTGWDHLTEKQHEAARAAARVIGEADMTFLMLLFGPDKQGAILANVEPDDAIKLIEHALLAARSIIEVDEIDIEQRLQ